MKYVVISTAWGEDLVILSPTMSHRDALKLAPTILGAGFIMRSTTTKSGFAVYGKSDSLGIGCRGADDQWLLDRLFCDE